MGAKFQGLTIFLIGVVATLSGLGIGALSGVAVKTIGGSTVRVYTPVGFPLEMFGIALIIGGIAWTIIGSRYRMERR